MFIPEITTRVSVEVDTSDIDNALSVIEGSGILSDMGLSDFLKDAKTRLKNVEKPLTRAVGEALQSNQETIISSKYGPPKSTGMMAQSVDFMWDGDDVLIGNTASSVDGFPYPLAIEKGTSRHWIEPVTFKALHWTDKTGEHWSKGHFVDGIDADPFVDPSIDDTIYQIEKAWEEINL